MSTKSLVWLGLFIGSTIGSYLPTLFGADLLSGWSIVGTAIGSFAGIYCGYQIGEKYIL
jgi:hypothetical protein